LFAAYDAMDSNKDSLALGLNEPIGLLKRWDRNSSENSIPETLAIQWGSALLPKLQKIRIREKETDQVKLFSLLALETDSKELLLALLQAIKSLESRYGTWKVAWGEINRYQRTTGQIKESYNDSLASLPVGLASSLWGSLPAFESRIFPGTKKQYGYGGNSFIAAVEFGKRLKAKSITTGGESSIPSSPHFSDQAEGYLHGQFKDVLFYPEDVNRSTQRSYHPGQ
jgi:acyl-homoserine-lactone acylase